MGEAKRRKKLDPDYGSSTYEISFFGRETEPAVKELWGVLEGIPHATINGIKFTCRGETILGVGLTKIVNRRTQPHSIRTDSDMGFLIEWVFHPEKTGKQKQIVKRFEDVIHRELCKQVINQAAPALAE